MHGLNDFRSSSCLRRTDIDPEAHRPDPLVLRVRPQPSILDRVCRDRPAQSRPVGNRSKFGIARAGNILVPDRSVHDSGVEGLQREDRAHGSADGRGRKTERMLRQTC